MKDLIILTSGCQLLSLISNYFWLLWLLVSPPNFVSAAYSLLPSSSYPGQSMGAYIYASSYYESDKELADEGSKDCSLELNPKVPCHTDCTGGFVGFQSTNPNQ